LVWARPRERRASSPQTPVPTFAAKRTLATCFTLRSTAPAHSHTQKQFISFFIKPQNKGISSPNMESSQNINVPWPQDTSTGERFDFNFSSSVGNGRIIIFMSYILTVKVKLSLCLTN
jgi:hypothetical protein